LPMPDIEIGVDVGNISPADKYFFSHDFDVLRGLLNKVKYLRTGTCFGSK
jgi:hypothetical protein